MVCIGPRKEERDQQFNISHMLGYQSPIKQLNKQSLTLQGTRMNGMPTEVPHLPTSKRQELKISCDRVDCHAGYSVRLYFTTVVL